ncbi:TrbC/VirB2 family protein [Legionella pneumophila serogroup 1]|uniref:TrbC/VirB2 family protein n=1 Tax=Legionella pneumophila TaxID=446 RepID=UPI0007707178|nr:TrbC/VirB2 family protein [Legionella pneumophila]HAT8958323.1 conjugal transfer protein TrbC [Legionella pneumophila subsp. pneumophila]MCH9063183.1 conjugal transfer protein TrbC [Legionella pneumophila serogroup 1]RYX29536.1 conjugal transfer protein TrbC [Legionella pneumophila]RYX47413.1 conjugal transfer protein TrbC [Legionella pneumophila]RYX49618.1 conjugal transfer protein TrbC [Legionella pneumophila]
MNQAVNMNYRSIYIMGAVILLLLLITHPACASSAGGGLPFDSYLTKIQKSITGPFAFTAAIIGLVGAGATLIFGGEMNGFLRTLLFIVLVLSFLVAAQNTMTAITGKGAEIAKPSVSKIAMETQP